MPSEMNQDKMQQVVRAVAREKVSLKDDQKAMTILALRKAFREVTPEKLRLEAFQDCGRRQEAVHWSSS